MYQVRTGEILVHHTWLSAYQTSPSFLNFFKISSRTFFPWPIRSTKKNIRALMERKGKLSGSVPSRTSRPASFARIRSWKSRRAVALVYRATMLLHNTCTCRRGKVDGRDLDARGSRVPEAARAIANSAEAEDRQECAYAGRKVVGRRGFSAPLFSLPVLFAHLAAFSILSPTTHRISPPSPPPSHGSCSQVRGSCSCPKLHGSWNDYWAAR